MPSRHAIATCLSLACALVMASAEPAVEASGKASNRKVLVDPIVLPTASDANSTAMSTGLPDNYVQVTNGRFAINGQPFVFAGWNIWEVLDAASYAPPPFRHLGRDGRDMIKLLMNQAVESGLTVMRMWGHTITPGHALQPEKGSYNEEIFEAMDFIMEEARIRGLKVIVVFADNWYPTGGLMNYVQWVKGDSGTRYDFFTNAEVKRLYKRNILAMLNRRNTKNGRLYKEDPTIMAWNLANEARCEDCDAWVMQSWIDEMAQYVKEQDDKHLLGVGHEGFYSKNSPNKDKNPGAPQSDWASKNGQSYPENLASSHIDYVAIHVWPDNWKMKTPDFLKKFTRGHVEDARYLGKPFVLEEFGKIVNDEDGKDVRDEYFKAAYEVAEHYALDADDGIVQGTLFWHWYDIGVGPGRYGLWYTDSTFDIVRDHASKMNHLSLAKARA